MSIVLCVHRGPVSARWELDALTQAPGILSLLGWRCHPPAADAGVPSPVAACLACALTRVCRLSFPTSRVVGAPLGEAWTPVPGGLGHALETPGLRAWSGHRGSPGWLLSTTDSRAAAGLFDDPGFPWWLRGQAAVASARDGPPPAVEPAAVLALLDDVAPDTKALTAAGVSALLRPGVDGDVAGLLALSEAADRALLQALAQAAREAGLGWELQPGEDAFARRLAASPPG